MLGHTQFKGGTDMEDSLFKVAAGEGIWNVLFIKRAIDETIVYFIAFLIIVITKYL